MYLQNLISVIKANRYFYITFAVLWLIGFYYQLTTTQFAISIWVNNWNSPPLDMMMIWLTNAGDGIFMFIAGALLIAFNRKWWLVVILCLSVPSTVTQFFKHLIFEDHNRPVILMANIKDLHYVAGVAMNQFNSFPSGHTTAAFSLYPLIALMVKDKRTGWIWVCIGTLVALSRVYLLQHFWADILAGSFIGVATCTLIFVGLQPKNNIHDTIKE
jgi:membrane-associated phospholipid phosphatase